jgi:NAD(P)-dependent dehydrogenase (short-subunit alcohol dehydrogenase family)
MGQVFTALRQAIQFAFGGDLSNHLFATLPVPTADLTDHTFLVTGSNTGIGFAAAVHLARLGPAHLILAVRDLKKGEAAKAQILAETGFSGALDVWELDMADFESVKTFAQRATSLERLDGALLNAGINGSSWGTTRDGWERMCASRGFKYFLFAFLTSLQVASQRTLHGPSRSSPASVVTRHRLTPRRVSAPDTDRLSG